MVVGLGTWFVSSPSFIFIIAAGAAIVEGEYHQFVGNRFFENPIGIIIFVGSAHHIITLPSTHAPKVIIVFGFLCYAAYGIRSIISTV